MKNKLRAFYLGLLLCLVWPTPGAGALQILGNRWIRITLIPDYIHRTIQFDAQIDLADPSQPLALDGLPLVVERQWMSRDQPTWNLTGSIQGGELTQDGPEGAYHLHFGSMLLQPSDRLSLILPFIDPDNARIEPAADPSDLADQYVLQHTDILTYRAGEAARQLPPFDIPFKPVVMNADLVFLPLLGETLTGSSGGLRLYGHVQFEKIKNFDVFSRYCQITPDRIQKGDFRVGHLLYSLDFPASFGGDVLNPAYENKPSRVILRSELSGCQYDPEQEVGQVDALFSGRLSVLNPDADLFPPELHGLDFPDGNYVFSPKPREKGVQGFVIQLGEIRLAPGDRLTIRLPHAMVQPGPLQPSPEVYQLENGGLSLVYRGPLSFDLILPYVPQAGLYADQFPALLRPGLLMVQDQLGSFSSWEGSRWTWVLLGAGILILLLSGFFLPGPWLAAAAWLLIAASFYYGIRGSFGLLAVVVLFFITRVALPIRGSENRLQVSLVTGKGLLAFALIALGVYLDSAGTSFFRDLSGAELSPLTPLVLMLVAGAIYLLFYGWQDAAKTLMRSDLAILTVMLAVLSLYDAFDKSLLALLILFTGITLVIRRVPAGKGHEVFSEDVKAGNGLRRRWKLAFGNRIVGIAILVLMVFAILRDLSSTYANQIQVKMSPLLAPVVIPVLDIVSVSLTFCSIALLFVLVYPFLPLKRGYLKAAVFALVLFLIFLFGIGTDDRLITSLPNILVGRVIYYLSVPMLIGVYLDIHEFMQKENKHRSAEGEASPEIDFQTAGSLYFKDLRGIIGPLASILSIVAPTVYAFLASQPVIVTYFDLLEKLVLLNV